MAQDAYHELSARFAAHGLLLRGGFVPRPEDAVPVVSEGRAAAAVLIIGNAGPEMWRHFAPHANDGPDALDRWTRRVVEAIAAPIGAKAVYPFQSPPLPFLRWAMRAEDVQPSPIGVLIHPEYGLWHAYRAALLLPGPIELPAPPDRPRPCETCLERPCLTACPVGAFDHGYDVTACRTHLTSGRGEDCLGNGCRARAACPVGAPYAPGQARFHMAAFQNATGTA